MATLFWAVTLAAIGYSIYKSGKHTGSRKGYNVGFRRGRSHRGRR